MEVIKWRNVLKWTYVYAYYCISDKNKPKKNQFEFWQTDLEKYCNTVHMLCEKPLDPFLDPNNLDRSPFYVFRSDFINKVEMTKKFFTSLSEGLESDTDQFAVQI